jgi:hypothetical protein
MIAVPFRGQGCKHCASLLQDIQERQKENLESKRRLRSCVGARIVHLPAFNVVARLAIDFVLDESL